MQVLTASLRESPGKEQMLEERRRKSLERIALKRRNSSQEESRRRSRERIAYKRQNESQEEREERLRKGRVRFAERRKNETDEAALQRRQKSAENRRLRAKSRIKNSSENVSSVNPSIRNVSLSQPTDAKFQNKTGIQFENQYFDNREQKVMTHSLQPSLPAHTNIQVQQQMQVQQHLQVNSSLPVPIQPAPRKVQLLALPVVVAKPKTVEKPGPQEKQIFVVADHQRSVMSNLASLWKSGKLCDASIGNGSSTVKVHKLVLYAVCPKLLSLSNMDSNMSHEFLQVNFPGEVSTEALNAFAEYMYNGILDLDHDILKQLKIIAKRLDMKEFEELCNSHLPNPMRQLVSAAAAPFTNILLIQTTMPIPAMTSSLGSTVSNSMQSAPSITTQIIENNQEISEDKLAQVKKEAAAMVSQESEVALSTPNKSGNAADSVISPVIKTEPVGPEDDKYGHWSGRSSNQAFTSTSSSFLSSSIAATTFTSIPSVPASFTEFAIPFSETTDVKSTKLEAPHSCEDPIVSNLSPVSFPSSQPSDSLPSIDLPNSNNTVYPVRLFSARGDNLLLLATHSSDAMTVNSYIPSEKT